MPGRGYGTLQFNFFFFRDKRLIQTSLGLGHKPTAPPPVSIDAGQNPVSFPQGREGRRERASLELPTVSLIFLFLTVKDSYRGEHNQKVVCGNMRPLLLRGGFE